MTSFATKGYGNAPLESGADDVPYLVGASASGGYADVISPPNDRVLEEGDILMMDTGAVFDGASGYRDYDPSVVDRLQFIRAGQAIGLTIRDLSQVLDIRDRGESPCRHVTELIDDKISDVDQRLGDLVLFGATSSASGSTLVRSTPPSALRRACAGFSTVPDDPDHRGEVRVITGADMNGVSSPCLRPRPRDGSRSFVPHGSAGLIVPGRGIGRVGAAPNSG